MIVSWKRLREDMISVIQDYMFLMVRLFFIAFIDVIDMITMGATDHPYILAFSLMMLHTDAFNRSNKNKMTKADYVKNTRLPGVPPEVLDVSPPLLITSFPC